jgi:hypothetical protein
VRFGGLRITTDPGCVDLGAEPFPIAVEVLGGLGDVELVWDASAGSITNDGVFTVPEQAQYVTITVALADKPAIESSIEFPVGGCSCSGSISVAGSTTMLETLRFVKSGSSVVSVNYTGSGPSGGSVSFGTDFLGDPVPFGETGGFDAQGQGSVTGTVWYNLSDINENDLSPISVTLQENTGSLLVGSAVGQVEVAADPDPEVHTLTFSFYIEADPDFSDDTMGFCEVVQPGQ